MEQNHPYGFIREGKIFRNAFLDFPEREIGEVRESEASTIKYFEDRFTMAENKVSVLEQSVEESENKGSYLMKLIHMREHLANFDALGDYVSLFTRLDAMEEGLRDIIAKNRVKNLEIKRALIADAEPYEYSTDWKEATDQLIEIKNKWIKTGAVDTEYQEEVEQRFQEILDNFYQKKKAFFNDRKQLVRDRVYRYRGLIFAARRLQRSEDRYDAMEKAKALQAEWKEIGKIPSIRYNELFREFRQTVGQIFKPSQPHRPYGSGSSEGYSSGGYPSGGYPSGGYPPRENQSRGFTPREGRFGPSRSEGGYSQGSGYSSRNSGSDFNHRPDRPESNLSPEEALSKKQDLIAQARRLENKENPVEDIKRLRLAWKDSGMVARDQSYTLNEEFNQACEMASEKSFLNRLAYSKNPDYDTISERERVLKKINLLQNLIARDEKDVELAQENSQTSYGYNQMDARQAENKLRIQKRKIIVKKKLMHELQEHLNGL